jgi:hypothetical protein
MHGRNRQSAVSAGDVSEGVHRAVLHPLQRERCAQRVMCTVRTMQCVCTALCVRRRVVYGVQCELRRRVCCTLCALSCACAVRAMVRSACTECVAVHTEMRCWHSATFHASATVMSLSLTGNSLLSALCFSDRVRRCSLRNALTKPIGTTPDPPLGTAPSPFFSSNATANDEPVHSTTAQQHSRTAAQQHSSTAAAQQHTHRMPTQQTGHSTHSTEHRAEHREHAQENGSDR